MKGILYMAKDPDYVEEAKISAKSAKTHMADIPITLVTECKVNSSLFDNVIVQNNMRGDFGDIPKFLDEAPYDRVLRCDTDIYFTNEIYELFDILDRFDIAIAQAPMRFATGRVYLPELENVPPTFPEYNGGLISYKNNAKFREFRDLWYEMHQKTLERGFSSAQSALRIALYYCDARIATLPEEYHCLVRTPGIVHGEVKVIHNRLHDVDGIGGAKMIDTEKAAKQLNRRTDRRVYYRAGSNIKFVSPNIINRFRDTLLLHGVPGTIKKLWQTLKKEIRAVINVK